MAKKKGQGRVVVALECMGCRGGGKRHVSRYSTMKNRRNTVKKLELRKYCRYERIHRVHKEI